MVVNSLFGDARRRFTTILACDECTIMVDIGAAGAHALGRIPSTW
jgi:hypothetical protein